MFVPSLRADAVKDAVVNIFFFIFLWEYINHNKIHWLFLIFIWLLWRRAQADRKKQPLTSCQYFLFIDSTNGWIFLTVEQCHLINYPQCCGVT